MADTFRKAESWQMFNRIARRYDVLNRLLSGRRDVVWRKKCAQRLPEKKPLTVLDLATGTGDLLLMLLKKRPNIQVALGLDPAIAMLSIAQRKLAPYAAILVNADAQHVCLKENSTDVITMAFGIRNVPDMSRAFEEMFRLLVCGGQVFILEFSLPSHIFIRKLYLLYFRHLLPIVGGFFSGDRQAYHYLNQTVENFPYGENFCRQLETAGFMNVKGTPLTFGIATLYSAEKPI